MGGQGLEWPLFVTASPGLLGSRSRNGGSRAFSRGRPPFFGLCDDVQIGIQKRSLEPAVLMH